MKKLQKSGKKPPAGNKRPRQATKTLKNQKSLEKNKKKTNILKNKLKKKGKKTNNIGHIWPYIWP